jgi:hypothetical protein
MQKTLLPLGSLAVKEAYFCFFMIPISLSVKPVTRRFFETPAEKESRKILPDVREGELKAFSAASEEK